MKFGVIYLLPDEKSFWPALEQAKVAEEAGFSHVFSVEHHFLEGYSLAAAPEIWLTAVAQHTSRIRIGHGVRLLPYNYNNPIRAAEMAATLDIMSNGRLDFGTGRSASELEIAGFSIDPNETRAQWDEALRMIPQMWTQPEFSWDSPTFKMPPRGVVPKPLQDPHPPLWMSGTQPTSSILAAERGIGYMHFSVVSTDHLSEQIAEYKRIVANPPKQVGLAINDQFAAFTPMFCGKSDEDAMKRGFPGISWYTPAAEAIYASLGNVAGGTDDSYEWYKKQFATAGKRARTEEDMRANHSMILGSPATCIKEAEWYAEQGTDLMLMLVQAGGVAHEDICDSLRRFGDEVIPKFQ